MASGKMQVTYRSQIWATCLWLRPPSLWLMINLMDYEDLIAQILAEEDINMDSFMESMGPEPSKRARNMTNDPFASVLFFNFTIRTTLETLFGIHVSKRQIESHMGILGLVNGYFGVVEVQGRGLLHVHMLIWLKHAPNMDEMLELLNQLVFQKKIIRYIDHNIPTHLDKFDEAFVCNNEHQPHTSFSRPPDPRKAEWKEAVEVAERKLARAHQVHVCKMSTCLWKDQRGNLICKRCAPWFLVEKTTVHASGMLDLQQTVLSIFEWVFARCFDLFMMQQRYKSRYIWKRYQESGMVSYELSKQRPFKDL
jgi:Helitron helicase-like domain at N-terminus